MFAYRFFSISSISKFIFFCHLSGRMLHENVLDYVLVGVLSHPFCPLQVLFLMPKPG